MKSNIKLMIFGLAMILMLGAVSAASVVPGATTVVAGKIYTADFKDVVPGANVDVTCGTSVNSTISKIDGDYSVTFSGVDCNQGSSLSVHAIKTGVGENTITTEKIHNNYPLVDLNLGVVNVPLVPEFGAVIGVLTVMGALGLFFVVRRK